MRKIHNLCLILMFLMLAAASLSGCITINFPEQGEPAGVYPSPVMTPTATTIPATPVVQIPSTAPPQPVSELTDEVLLNGEYLSPVLQVPIRLVNGSFSGNAGGTQLEAIVTPEIQYGDLNGDSVDDAAFLLSENTGGSGIFVTLMVVFSVDGGFQQAPGVPVDDRPVLDGIIIDNGLVKLTGLVHAPNDPMVSPTTRMRAEYSLFGGQMVLTRYASAFGGGVEHSILIESPVDGTEVSGTLQLTGSMPIGPFENNLLLQIVDPVNRALIEEGFMVQAADMGAPATFEKTISIPDVPTGQQILIVLSELSMADGRPIAVDSVLVTVGQ